MKETGTIFDLVQPEIGEGVEGYMDLARNAPSPKDNSFLNSIADYAKTFIKGSVEGISKLGTMMSHTYETPEFENGKLKPSRGSKESQLQEQTLALDELLPTEEGFAQSALRRGLNEAPSMMAFPGSPVQAGSRSLVAGLFGETAKELGAPEWAQSAAELTAFIGPDITKKLLASGKNKELIEAAKKFGLTDEQIAPLIQSEFKQKWLSKITPKRGATQKALASTKEALGEAYNLIQKSEEAAKSLPQEYVNTLFEGLYKHLQDMPSGVKETIINDLKQLVDKPITGESLINFYKDVNHNLSGNTKQLANLKQPIKDALSAISPEMGKDFEMVNKLFTKYHPIAERLKPTLTSDLISAAEAIGLLGGITMGYTPSITAILGEQLTKKVAQQMLINPRLQQLSQKMIKAMNENKIGIVKKLAQSFSSQLRKEVPEASNKLDELTISDLEDFFKNQ